MPHNLVLKAMNTSHRLLLAVSRGRIGWTAGDMPVLELTTIGRRSGLPRSVMLTSPLTEGGNLVIVASRGGDDHHPAWFLNLRDEPKVDVAVKGGPRIPMIARIADAEERSRMWPHIAGKYRNYDGYQKRTQREIPLVVLHPTGV
jgi:deazaflavin-dependent oxidoreductase (nitroreductase family)